MQTRRIEQGDREVQIVTIEKGVERYVLIIDPESRASRSQALRTLGYWAADHRLSFSWYDAAIASKRIRETAIINRSGSQHETDTRID